MTNEQLGILLEWIANSIEDEIAHLAEHLIQVEGIERKPHLYKDGERWGWGGGPVFGQEEAEARGFEIRHEGVPIALDGLYSLIEMIRRQSLSVLK